MSSDTPSLWYQAIQHAGAGLLIADGKGIVQYLNPVGQELTGCTLSEAKGRPISDVLKLWDERKEMFHDFHLSGILAQGKAQSWPDALRLKGKGSAREAYVSGSSTPLVSADAETGILFTFFDVTPLKVREAEIRHHSFYDPLTGLYNRAFFEEELKRMDSERLLPITLILGDGNGLKLVNDAFGHQAGDELLTRLGAILKEVCRQEDVVARVGGDEFVIILPGVDCDEAKKVIRRIRQRCSAAPSEPFKPSIALGAATKQYKEQSIQMVYRQAEERMYAVKLSESRGIRSDIIRSIQRTLARHTHETEEHGNRLRILMSAVGAKLQLHAYEINGLELLADLHDIGKIAVPVHILEKPEGLLYDEWKLIKKHCEIGYRIAVFSPVLVSIADAILSHHEHWDGKGYPQGLSREMIPLSARILAIADTYDILTHDRPYRKAISPDGALNEIIRCSGTQFDPMLVDVFVEVLRERAGEHRRAEGE